MKFLQLRPGLFSGMAAIAIAGSVLLASCGGGSSDQSAGVGGTGIVAGEATDFGSIYVNGSRYDTDLSSFTVDGVSFPDQAAANLQVGMYVKLKVETLDGNFTGKALEVVYDDEVQGPVKGISTSSGGVTQRTFTVFGQNITIDETTTIFNGTTFADLDNDDVVEISGFRTSDIDITASYVEFKGILSPGSEVELRGIIGGYVPPTPEFMLDGVLIRFDPMTTTIEVPNGILMDGLFVEVEGTYQEVPERVDADEIEEEDEDFGDDVDDISLQGVISNYDPITGGFKIGGLPIDTSQATELSPANVLDLIDDGVEIEVEGDIVGGVFIADEVELREGESELRSFVSSVDPASNSFVVSFPPLPGTVVVHTNGQTTFEDEAGPTPLENLSLSDLVPAVDFVKVEGIADGGEITAEVVKRRDTDDTELAGAVEAFDNITFNWITVLGVTYNINPNPGGTDFVGFPDAATFFGQLIIGDIIEIQDNFPADGIADEVEEE